MDENIKKFIKEFNRIGKKKWIKGYGREHIGKYANKNLVFQIAKEHINKLFNIKYYNNLYIDGASRFDIVY